MKRKLQVFVSSTYKDLLPERQAAVEAILKAGHIPAGMELFAAGNESQWQTIKRWIEESDVYMLILGGRYGSLEPNSHLSYTELEYDYAVALEKPYFAVVETEEALNDRVKVKGKDVLELNEPQKLAVFRAKVMRKTSSFFSDYKDVKLAVHESIRDLEARHKMTGWVSGADVPNVHAIAEEVVKLRQENEKLLKAKAALKSPPDEEEMQHIYDLLTKMKVAVPAFVAGKETENDLLSLFYYNRHVFTHGIENSVDAGKHGEWMFSHVGAPLEAHELVANEKIAGSPCRRLVLSKKGARFLAFVDRLFHSDKKASIKQPPKGAEGKT